ncbi:RICIN domain-containing protein [Streptomyces sp. NPDC090022]|uniref:RICIN domain-containing protein n=1 Tax=Streptomyces sp. NPDC090022 TaxID=3365920 RepID=UPI003819C24A
MQRGSGNLQINLHEHRTGLLSACAVALVCVATVIAVRVGGDDPGAGAGAASPGIPPATRTPAPTPPGTPGADPPVLTGRLVNGDGGLCLRAPGTEEGLVPVQDTCTDGAERTWALESRDGGATRTLRNAHSGHCLALAGTESLAPARQLACAAGQPGQRWELLRGDGDRAGQFMLRSTGNAKCLVAQRGAVAGPAVQISCGEHFADQWWRLVTASGPAQP